MKCVQSCRDSKALFSYGLGFLLIRGGERTDMEMTVMKTELSPHGSLEAGGRHTGPHGEAPGLVLRVRGNAGGSLDGGFHGKKW